MPREFPEKGMIEFAAKIPKPLYNRFLRLFPQHGSTSWFIRNTLERFVEAVERDPDANARLKEAVDDIILHS